MPISLADRIRAPRPRSIIYTRVSKDLREGRSVAEQEAECRRDVEREGWDLVRVRSDNNVSASRYSKKERPDWLAMLEDIRANLVDVVVFWEMSRGTRHRREWADLAELAEDKGLFICVRGRVYDSRDSHDMAYLDALVSRGVEESAQTRERINRTVKSQAKKGAPHGAPVFGMRSVYDPKTGVLLERVVDLTPWPPPDGPESPGAMVRHAARIVLGGTAPWRVVAAWNQRGIPAPEGGMWAAETLVQLLRRPSIMGKRTYHGEIVDVGGWEPIVSEADYWALQEKLQPGAQRDPNPQEAALLEGPVLLDGPAVRPVQSRIRDGDAVHVCSGIVRCGVCASRTSVGMNGGVLSYRCRGSYPGVAKRGCTSRAVHLLDEHVEVLLVAEFTRPDVLDRFRPAPVAEEERERDLAEVARLRADRELARQAAKAKGPSRLPVATLLEVEAELGAQIAEVEQRLKPAPAVNPMAVELASEDPAVVLGRWRRWPVDRKRSALRSFTRSVRLLPVGRVGRRKLLPEESVEIVWVSQEGS